MLSWKLESTYLALPELFYSFVNTDTVPAPEWAVFNTDLAQSLGLGDNPDADDLVILAGNKAPFGSRMYAQSYAGHQFGHFTKLGDGRAAVLGEVLDRQGQRHDLQLKGSGPTPYARSGDGKAVLGPMLREYLIGEYMHAVGLPSSRALSVVLTGETIRRDGFKPGAVLCRAAASHLRVGTFQYVAVFGGPEPLAALADYAIERHYPQLREETNPYLAFLDAVGESQTDLVARWMCLGFVHGVMNTDNVAISGQAIDFGPCAFLDAYRSDQVFSSIDQAGRYAWGNQAAIAGWNQARLAEALLPLLDKNPDTALALARESVERFNDSISNKLTTGFARKLGWHRQRPGDETLIQQLLHWMEDSQADYSTSFVALSRAVAQLDPGYPLPPDSWLEAWRQRLWEESASADPADPAALMAASNPPLHPRNRPVQAALDAAELGDWQPFQRLAGSLADPWNPSSALPELEPSDVAGQPVFRTYCGT